ncbi:hypothetical protein HanXRQr2_Chr16g0724621 [Helianthus annuus]|uniref:Uncharacterized protein n=1 Tax=Helianthus annuus TaxID=4232 RepID=A0A9K3GW33_HELAN|nr:hypothetical protein HanXRQr2_Chr16g0724621 [Helianthus annuus]
MFVIASVTVTTPHFQTSSLHHLLCSSCCITPRVPKSRTNFDVETLKPGMNNPCEHPTRLQVN